MSAQEKYPYYPAGQPVPETPDPGSPPKPWGKTNIVGKRQPRVDGYELPLDESIIARAAAAAMKSARPLDHNEYKIDLFKGLLAEELAATAQN